MPKHWSTQAAEYVFPSGFEIDFDYQHTGDSLPRVRFCIPVMTTAEMNALDPGANGTFLGLNYETGVLFGFLNGALVSQLSGT